MAGSELMPVPGIRLGVSSAGIKTAGRPDLVVLEIAPQSSIGAVFTRNAFCAAPVTVAREHWQGSRVRFLLVNTGNANAGTGERGLRDARESCRALAALGGVDADQVMPFSTGVIGEHLPMDRLTAGMPAAMADLSEVNWGRAAAGIMTTDTRPKGASRVVKISGERVVITGIAKGAGMIRPNMATMLAFLATDAAIAPEALQELWQSAVENSFNRVTVDGDTSTNDAAILVATGAAKHTRVTDALDPSVAEFRTALDELALELAHALVRDGEGASKFVAVEVNSSRSESEALQVAYTIAHSPLVKTALFAGDPNWGRLLAAIGRAGVDSLIVEEVELRINDVLVACGGCRAPGYSEAAGQRAMAASDITIAVDLNRGAETATVWTSDLSYDYVRINAEYRT
jgi:glutamate N-acetyltransferase/amino-acid N-acetyltransferase